MGGESTFADLATVAAGVAVIIAVVALLTSAEVAKRLQRLVEQKLADNDVKLAVALQQQDRRLTTLRQIMSQNAEDHETAIRTMRQDIKEIKECIALMREILDRMDTRSAQDATHPHRRVG
jgi:CRISPR/Cas system CMR subunit Cmr4 (Cas7 group RAMP superfamily)